MKRKSIMRDVRFLSFVFCCVSVCIIVVGCRRAPTSARPTADNVYRMPLTDNPITLDPALFTDVNSGGVARRIFNGLVKLDASLKPVGDIAESWDISLDGLTYTFHLRSGVRFHNGRELTADDVRYSFERLLRPETKSRSAWVVEPVSGGRDLREGTADKLGGLETPDERTVILTLESPFPPILSQLAMINAAIVPREEVEKTDVPFGRRPVGTGPFQFKMWRDNDVLELERNDGYFEGPAKLSGIRFRVIKEAQVAWQEYLAGNLEHCAVPEGMLEGVRTGMHGAELQSMPTLSTYYIGILMPHDVLGKNVHLRRAINYAIDRQFLCEKVLDSTHTPAHGVLPPGLPGYNSELEGYPFDIERAQAEMVEAGYGYETAPPELTLFCKSVPRSQQVAEVIQSDLKRIGIKANIRMLDLGALIAAINDAEPDMFYLSWSADFPDADNFLQLFHSSRIGGSGNRAQYTNSEVDRLLGESRHETDSEKRVAIFCQIEETVVADAPWIFLSHGQTNLVVKPHVRNFDLTPMDVGTSVNQVDFHKVSFAEK